MRDTDLTQPRKIIDARIQNLRRKLITAVLLPFGISIMGASCFLPILVFQKNQIHDLRLQQSDEQSKWIQLKKQMNRTLRENQDLIDKLDTCNDDLVLQADHLVDADLRWQDENGRLQETTDRLNEELIMMKLNQNLKDIQNEQEIDESLGRTTVAMDEISDRSAKFSQEIREILRQKNRRQASMSVDHSFDERERMKGKLDQRDDAIARVHNEKDAIISDLVKERDDLQRKVKMFEKEILRLSIDDSAVSERGEKNQE